MNLTLDPGILEEITTHAKSAYPNEGCGLLVGRNAGNRFIPIRNTSPDAAHFEMDPAELVKALRDLRHSGEDLIAICHSHPHGPAKPSATDVDRAYYPEAAHLIVSLAEPECPQVAAFRIVGGEVIEIEVHVIV